MESHTGNTLESQEMKEVLQKLEVYVAQGYLLHGSKNQIEVLEPRQARDKDKENKATNLNAVYATHDTRIPIFMALFGKKDASQNGWSSFYSATNKEEMRIGGENVTFTPGYIHVLPADKFQEVPDKRSKETVSFEPVAPIDVVRITPDILEFIPGIIYEMD